MRDWKVSEISSALLPGLLCLLAASSAATAECKYSKRSRDAVVRPVLEKSLGKDEARYYENSEPTAETVRNGTLLLRFRRQPFKTGALPDGTIIDDGTTDVMFDTCKLRAWKPHGPIL